MTVNNVTLTADGALCMFGYRIVSVENGVLYATDALGIEDRITKPLAMDEIKKMIGVIQEKYGQHHPVQLWIDATEALALHYDEELSTAQLTGSDQDNGLITVQDFQVDGQLFKLCIVPYLETGFVLADADGNVYAECD